MSLGEVIQAMQDAQVRVLLMEGKPRLQQRRGQAIPPTLAEGIRRWWPELVAQAAGFHGRIVEVIEYPQPGDRCRECSRRLHPPTQLWLCAKCAWARACREARQPVVAQPGRAIVPRLSREEQREGTLRALRAWRLRRGRLIQAHHGIVGALVGVGLWLALGFVKPGWRVLSRGPVYVQLQLFS